MSRLEEGLLPNPQSEFSQTHNIGNNANIGIGGFTMWKKNPVKNVNPRNRILAPHDLWF